MKAAPLLVAWHNDSAPIYSLHFQPTGKHRLATAGGDNNVRLWQIQDNGRDVTYLSTLTRHSQAVNVVRWCPKGDLLASAGDDGNVLLWVPLDHHSHTALGEDSADDKESWHVKRMCRTSTGREIYDLAWSPDGAFFIVGSMDNVARIFDASTGNTVRQIAEHNHYVQGVAWDPLNEFLATQSSDRSVHVYALKTNDGQFSLQQHSRMAKMDLPPRRRRTSNSPAPPDIGTRGRLTSDASVASSTRGQSPAPSMPGTPASLPIPMPPPSTHSRRSSISNASPSVRRSASPAPSMPLPAVMSSASPNPHADTAITPVKNTNIYANETLTSFFRRLTFAPDGSLLFTPAGQYKTSNPSSTDTLKSSDEIINTCYIYGRGGLNKPPIAHLPGHRKPSIAVRCSPVFYTLRLPVETEQITVDTSAPSEDAMPPLPEPAHPPHTQASAGPTEAGTAADSSAKDPGADEDGLPPGPPPAFALPYRIVYAVATQDAVYVYDTQQQTPLCVVSNLHYATFTDLSWSKDGLCLLMSSSDGFASSLSFSSDELGKVYQGALTSRAAPPTGSSVGGPSPLHSTSAQTPTQAGVPLGAPAMVHRQTPLSFVHSPSPMTTMRPASPTRSNSASSVATQSSFVQQGSTSGHGGVINNPTPVFGKLPSLAATHSGSITSVPPPLTSPTPPMTPSASGTADMSSASAGGSFAVPSGRGSVPPNADQDKSGLPSVAGKREAISEPADAKEPKKRRVAPTLVNLGADQGPG